MGLFRKGRGAGESDGRTDEAERGGKLAVIVEAIRLSVGVTLRDEQIAVGLMMCDQLDGRRPRRTKRDLALVGELLSSAQDRSLAAALPVFLHARRGPAVHVMTATYSRARDDARLYDRIDGELGGRGVGLLSAGQPEAERMAVYRCGVTVGDHQEFERDVVDRGVAVVRFAEDESLVARHGSFVDRRYPRVARLPERGVGRGS